MTLTTSPGDILDAVMVTVVNTLGRLPDERAVASCEYGVRKAYVDGLLDGIEESMKAIVEVVLENLSEEERKLAHGIAGKL